MKTLTKVFVIAFCFLCTTTVLAQDTNNPWIFGVSTNAINNPDINTQEKKGQFKAFNMSAASFKISAGRHIKKRFSSELTLSLNAIQDKFALDKDNTQGKSLPYIAIDGMGRYKLTNFLVFDPYLAFGAGYTWLDSNGSFNIIPGIGANIWLGDHFGFNIQSVYKKAFSSTGLNHQQYSIGFTFKLGGKDSDGDGIYDGNDECPNTFGIAEANGCPDTDRDGVVDSLDLCPETPGDTDLRGCPDRDKDDVPDKYDRCPDQPGVLEAAGCPIIDTDNDGVADNKDQCPRLPGSKENNGCPLQDTDRDGVPDVYDKCPRIPGSRNNSGCPLDTDNDGIPDNLDKCPKQPGLRNNDGCPISKDQDKDGIPDELDKCPNIKGPQKNNGCPDANGLTDTDKDGIPDQQDKCPKTPGNPRNYGCPQ